MGPSNLLLGCNYARNKVRSANDILTGDATNTASLTGGPWIAASNTTITQDIEDWAVFGNAEFAISDTLTVLGGARYTKSRNDFSSCMRGDIGMQTTFSVLSDVLSGTPGAPAGPETCLNMNKTTFELIRPPDRKSTRLNSSPSCASRMPSSA